MYTRLVSPSTSLFRWQSVLEVRLFRTAACCQKDNKEWKEMIRAEKAKKAEKLAQITKANPFRRNVGIKRQMMNMGFKDVNDPAIYKDDDQFDIDDQLEHILSDTDRFSPEVGQKIPTDQVIGKAKLRRIMTKKKFFPDPIPPDLLTWMEKQTIRKLAKEDPVEWTPQRLAECFPANEKAIVKVIKSKGTTKLPPQGIKVHDLRVKENWRLLAEGKLQLPPDVREHLQKNEGSVNGIAAKFSPTAQRELEQDILTDYALSLQPIRPKLTGEFGSIVATYKKKVEQKHLQLGPPDNVKQTVLEVKHLLDEHSDFRESMDLPSPYGGTSLINVEGSKVGKPLTMKEFRKTYLMRNVNKMMKDNSEVAQGYFEWLTREDAKDRLAEVKKPKKLDVESVLNEIEPEKQEEKMKKYLDDGSEKDFELYEDVKGPQKQKTILLDNKVTGKTVEMPRREIKLQIDIPKEVYKEGAVYQMHDCFYDSSGEFLHRIPGAALKN